MIKKGIYVICTAFALGCSGCNDWLTVVPETSLVADNLFETNEGVLQALDGAYILAAEDIYRPNGSMGNSFVDLLACSWTTENNVLADHEYNIDNTAFGGSLDNKFSQCYKIINTLNPMIEACEVNKNKLREDYYHIVKGEGLAFRACLHLDLIRLWGPMPSRVNSSTEYLPYVSKNSSKNYKYSTFEEYMNLLIADLDEAEKLLQQSDPILKYPADGSSDYTGDWTGRKSHFNYYGVLGLQARARLWKGDKEGALRYAKMVKEAKNEDGSSKFVLATAENMGSKLFYVEHLCGTEQASFDYQDAKNGFASTQLSYYNENYNSFVKDLFGDNSNDMRNKNQWSWNYDPRNPMMRTRVSVTTKFNDLYPSSTAPKNMPIVRFAEMYLIIMETGTLGEANIAYEEFCSTRNIPYIPMTEETRSETVKWEYLREFIAEGQNFFTYKRFAVKRMLWQNPETDDCGEEQYVLPLPPSEYKER